MSEKPIIPDFLTPKHLRRRVVFLTLLVVILLAILIYLTFSFFDIDTVDALAMAHI